MENAPPDLLGGLGEPEQRAVFVCNDALVEQIVKTPRSEDSR